MNDKTKEDKFIKGVYEKTKTIKTKRSVINPDRTQKESILKDTKLLQNKKLYLENEALELEINSRKQFSRFFITPFLFVFFILQSCMVYRIVCIKDIKFFEHLKDNWEILGIITASFTAIFIFAIMGIFKSKGPKISAGTGDDMGNGTG